MPHLSHGPFTRFSHGSLRRSRSSESLRGNDPPSTQPEGTFVGKSINDKSPSISSLRLGPTSPSHPTGANAKYTSRIHRNTAGIGAEPGINPRGDGATAQYGYFQQECVIDVIDYSCEHVASKRVSNAEFVELMQNPLRRPDPSPTKPSSLRWINIGGLSWDVISAAALNYGTLHPIRSYSRSSSLS